MEIFPESRPRILSKHLEQKVEGHFIYNNCEFNLQIKMWKVLLLANFAIVLSWGVYKSVAKHRRHPMLSNIEGTFDMLPKHLNSAIAKLFYCLSRG